MNTIQDPFKITYTNNGYKVNKPNDQSGAYVDLQIAIDLLNELKVLKSICEEHIEEFNRPYLNELIKQNDLS